MYETEHIYLAVETAISDKLYEMGLEDLSKDFIKKNSKFIAEEVDELIDNEISLRLGKIQVYKKVN